MEHSSFIVRGMSSNVSHVLFGHQTVNHNVTMKSSTTKTLILINIFKNFTLFFSIISLKCMIYAKVDSCIIFRYPYVYWDDQECAEQSVMYRYLTQTSLCTYFVQLFCTLFVAPIHISISDEIIR